MPTAKEIIIRLINEKIINGEEAYVLLNAILQSELMEAWKVLDESKEGSKKNSADWLQFTGPYTTTTTGITWTKGSNTITCDAANSATSTLSTTDLIRVSK